jgi:hypothetical protein
MPNSYIPAALDRQIRAAANNRCGYCQSPQYLVPVPFHIEHLHPRSQGRSDDETNLWLSCPLCNGHKSDKISGIDPETGQSYPFFNPRTQQWNEHFRWSEDGIRIIGLTPIGRVTVIALHLSDDPLALEARSYWVSAGWHPPKR